MERIQPIVSSASPAVVATQPSASASVKKIQVNAARSSFEDESESGSQSDDSNNSGRVRNTASSGSSSDDDSDDEPLVNSDDEALVVPAARLHGSSRVVPQPARRRVGACLKLR